MIFALLRNKFLCERFTMNRPTDVNDANDQMQRAQQLLAEGQHEEALVLALDALQMVLRNLRESLLSFQQNLAKTQEEKEKAEFSQKEIDSLTTFIQRIYH